MDEAFKASATEEPKYTGAEVFLYISLVSKSFVLKINRYDVILLLHSQVTRNNSSIKGCPA